MAEPNKNSICFPHPCLADAEGLVATGGALDVERLLAAYRCGIFPWSANPVTWWSPDPRAILPLDHTHIPRSLVRVLRQNRFELTIDTAFEDVIKACASPAPGRTTTWISPEFVEAYAALHRHGSAHSVECWLNDELVGGIYGVSIGGFFAGESMFHRVSNASKIALLHLIEHLRKRGFALFDIQMRTAVTQSFGAIEISRNDYLKRLHLATASGRTFI